VREGPPALAQEDGAERGAPLQLADARASLVEGGLGHLATPALGLDLSLKGAAPAGEGPQLPELGGLALEPVEQLGGVDPELVSDPRGGGRRTLTRVDPRRPVGRLGGWGEVGPMELRDRDPPPPGGQDRAQRAAVDAPLQGLRVSPVSSAASARVTVRSATVSDAIPSPDGGDIPCSGRSWPDVFPL